MDEVEVQTDDRDSDGELGLIIRQTANLPSTYITHKVPATDAIYRVIGL